MTLKCYLMLWNKISERCIRWNLQRCVISTVMALTWGPCKESPGLTPWPAAWPLTEHSSHPYISQPLSWSGMSAHCMWHHSELVWSWHKGLPGKINASLTSKLFELLKFTSRLEHKKRERYGLGSGRTFHLNNKCNFLKCWIVLFFISFLLFILTNKSICKRIALNSMQYSLQY